MTLSKSQLLQLRRKELELLQKRKEAEEILPHLYIPMYPWQRELHDSLNRVNLLTAANQIGKSSCLIRRIIANSTDPHRWERLWGPRVKPKQFWYFYPDGLTVEKEVETKWIPEWLPRGPMERDAQYGWKIQRKNNRPDAIHFNAGPIIYFQMYTKSVKNVQAGSIHEVYCFTKGTSVVTTRGKLDVSEVVSGDLILSHLGFCKVYETKTRVVEKYRELLLEDGTKFNCTDEHPFFTQRGWVQAKDLTKQDVCFKQDGWAHALSTLISYYLKEDSILGNTGTLTVESQTTGGRRSQGENTCMLLYGKLGTVKKFLAGMLSTIKTSTRLITTFPIFSVLLWKSTHEYIKSRSGNQKGSTKEFVRNVAKLLLQDLLKRQFAFVQPSVQENTKKESVLNAIVNFLLAKTPRSVSVLKNVPIQASTKVYNFSVEKSHTFFANGTLTHNCDEEMPLEFYDELMFRLTATSGIFTSGFTPTLNQLFWKQAMEGNKVLPRALKLTVSMYDCLKYEDGSPSRVMTLDKIREAESKCKNDTEKQRRIWGRFITEEGRTYYAFDFDKHVVPPKKIDKWYIYAAVDYGSGKDPNVEPGKKKKNHPAAIVYLAVRHDYKKGAVYRSWRGDNVKTTAGDVFNKYVELSKDVQVTQACYDAAAVDFGTIATRSGVSFVKADKQRDTGEDLVNTLFKHGMLEIFDDDPENMKLAGELLHIMISNQAGDAKKDDDLADALRYACKLVPWDLSVINEKIKEELEAKDEPPRPMTEQEFQAMQIKLRRGEDIGGPQPDTAEGWSELESEFDHWNSEYGT